MSPRALYVLPLVGCLNMVLSEENVSGELHGTYGGKEWVLAPETCVSGQHKNYFGVELAGTSSDSRAILREDPLRVDSTVAARRLTLTFPGNQAAVILSKDECKVFEMKLRREDATYTDVGLMNGSVAVDCQAGPLGRVQGRLEFSNCH